MSAAEAAIARLAAELLEQHGHCKGSLSDGEGRMCMWGALGAASTQLNDEQAYDNLYPFFFKKFYDEATEHDGVTILVWPGAEFNDAPETTAKDVQKVLLTAADELEFL